MALQNPNLHILLCSVNTAPWTLQNYNEILWQEYEFLMTQAAHAFNLRTKQSGQGAT